MKGVLQYARLSSTPQDRRARIASDIANANRAWGTGFSPGVSCEINFVSGGTWNATGRTINASLLSASLNHASIDNLIKEIRRNVGDLTAIYVLYLSGEAFSNGSTVGVGGTRQKFNNSNALVGHIALTNRAGDTNSPYLFAHEAGHCLGLGHFRNSQNLMYGNGNRPVPRSNPFLTSGQCRLARQSKLILQNATRNSRRS
ncbi:hypothetical protein ACFPYJ_10305 [Paenibacillus solisilvae]|uniref:Peptidase M10 metallopeptidase domain-containing protein n=1 Tax=Paenibacillus solisilvae TaxID=2486751 RepID=A0ABW0VWB8_9BACL